jgi:4-amino-4-deoxy-L-arabinose transferase-like glycosyltransferase
MDPMTSTDHHATRWANAVLLSLALVYFLLEWIPGFVGSYGYFIDELYYLACAERLAFGYVDHPPLSIFLLWLVRAVAGDSLPALRLVPSLAGAATVLVTGLLARRLGAGLFGQALAAGAAMIGSIYHVMFSFYSMNSLSILFWATCFWILVEIEVRKEPRLWLAFGATAGLGLLNKHTIVLLAMGLAVGLVLTPARRHLGSRWLWIGLGIAVLLLIPNLLWQQAHGWPSLEFYRNADIYKNVPTPPLEVLKQQVLFMNPAALPVWLAGGFFLLATKRGRAYRHLGWMFVALLLLLLVGQKSRPDRIAAAYTILFAGGGVLLEQIARHARGRWLRPALPIILILFGAALAPIGLPLLPPDLTASYATTLGIVPQIEAGAGKRTELPQWLADRFGWEQIVDDVEAVVATLDPDERRRAMILVPTYGQAGAIELFGRGRDLPPVYSTQNNYFFWGPPEETIDVAIVAGFGEETLRWLFEEAEPVRVHDCEWCMPWRDEMQIWLARGCKVSFAEAWPELKHFE